MKMNRRDFLVAGAALGSALQMARAGDAGGERPNILWLTCEDMGPHLGCYGVDYVETPNLDSLAEKGLRYRVCWSNAPVCAPARTTLIAGIYATSSGGQHMRSSSHLPDDMLMYPCYLRQAGYYCTNNSKEDYNLRKTGEVWDESSRKAHWQNRKPGQPFFAIFNFTTTHESQIRNKHELRHDPADAPVPAYHPDVPEVRRDWAQYYDRIEEMDRQAGQRLAELEEAGLADDTIVFFYGDHGSGMPRSKRWPYNSGEHTALIVYIPEKWKHLAPAEYKPGGWSDRLVSFVDMPPTLLSLIGADIPEWMQGYAFAGKQTARPQAYVHGFRGRMDERYDMVRSMRDERYIYIRNYWPHVIYGQYVGYMFQTPTTRVWKEMYNEGKLNEAQRHFWEKKPPEELYDLQNDPDEVNNLADSPDHQDVVRRMRQAMRAHLLRIRDVGFLPESEIHGRSEDSSPYTMAHNPDQYPIEKIMAAAERASSLDPRAVPQLLAAMGDDDSAVRYWGTMGLLMRGKSAVDANKTALRAALKDSSPNVRVAAAWALGEYGNDEDIDAAVETLFKDARNEEQSGAVALFSVYVLDNLQKQAGERITAAEIQEIQDWNKGKPGRVRAYVPRVTEKILSDLKGS